MKKNPPSPGLFADLPRREIAQLERRTFLKRSLSLGARWRCVSATRSCRPNTAFR